ncbi:unnamed protein product [Camellia sinensis]
MFPSVHSGNNLPITFTIFKRWTSSRINRARNRDNPVKDIVQSAFDLLRDFTSVTERVLGVGQRFGLATWKAPAAGIYKLNFDGAVFDCQQSIGIGVVVGDSNGDVIAALSEQRTFWVGADCAEAYVAARTVSFVQELALQDVQFEGDSMTLYDSGANFTEAKFFAFCYWNCSPWSDGGVFGLSFLECDSCSAY